MKILTPANKSFTDSLSEAFLLSEPSPDDTDEYFYYNILKNLNKDYIPLYLGESLLKEFTREYYEKRKVIYMYFMMNKPVEIIENTVKELRNL